MEINVAQQLKGPIGSVRNYEVSEIVDIDGGSRPVQGKVELMRTNRGILAKGALCVEIEVVCSRCLSPSGCSLSLNIEEEYFPVTDAISGAAIAVPDEPGCFTIDENHFLDLTEAISQYTLLAVPMKPLCREDCAGLCSICGHNLNQCPCGCSSQEAGVQWSEWKERLSSAKGKVREKSVK